MPTGKMWIYRLLFVCFCTVKDFSADDKASGVQFCTAVHRRTRQGTTKFCELCSARSPKSDNRRARGPRPPLCKRYINVHVEMRRRKRHARDAPLVEYRAACGRRIGMCGWRSVPTDVLVTCMWHKYLNSSTKFTRLSFSTRFIMSQQG